MYKLLIVDDEQIEREGMANFIPWENYDIQLVGTACNGVEGLALARQLQPDIVLTDIEMPFMNGIELIRKLRESFPFMECVVLSGYGDFEYTSQAMEQGIRHYILKPCDEDKIADVFSVIKAEIETKRAARAQTQDYQKMRQKMLPRALEQLMRNMLLNKEVPSEDHAYFFQKIGGENTAVVVLGLKKPGSRMDYLDQFALGNILGELLHVEGQPLTAAVEDVIYFLLPPERPETVERALEETAKAVRQLGLSWTIAAVSQEGSVQNLPDLYQETQELFSLGALEKVTGLLYHSRFHHTNQGSEAFFDYGALAENSDFETLLFETYLALSKMELQGYSFAQKKRLCDLALHMLERDAGSGKSPLAAETEQELLAAFTQRLSQRHPSARTKSAERIQQILLAIYQNIANTELNISYLAREILYMNEDYLGRMFQKERKAKFSSYLIQRRIDLAKKLLEYQPDLKIFILTELIGFSPDGQYFSKAFRKLEGMTPTEYRDMLLKR